MVLTRVGIIGLSTDPTAWANLAHVDPLRSKPLSDHYELTAVATSSDKTAKAAAEYHKIPTTNAFHSAKGIAKSSDVDMVVVSVKLPLHKELTLPILEAKKEIFVEWPLARNVEEAEELAAFAKKQAVRTAVGLQARCLPVILKAKEMIDSGALGRVITTNVFASSSMLVSKFPEKYRYFNDTESGANQISINTAHLLDPLCFLLGEFSFLNATTAITFPTVHFAQPDGSEVAAPRTFADSIMIQGVTKSGVSVSFMNASTTNATPDSVEWTISGEKGSLRLSGKNTFLAFEQPKLYISKERGWEELQTEVPYFGGIGGVYQAFTSKKEGNYTGFEEAVVRHRMVEAIYRSAKNGTRESY
ncbi:MAG: hypothetical protein Q9191_005524 [Dirinaria sp. TL-2023a]